MKNVLVTGANKGIGFEVAKQMAELGYYVFLGCRDIKKGLQAVNQLKELNILNAEALKIDVSDPDSIRVAASVLTSKIEALDILINNAGIPGPQPQNISQCDISLVKELFDTNVFGVMQTTQAMIPLLQKANQPVIVNVSSELGSLVMQNSEGRNPNWDMYHVYGSSKTALNAFTIAFANEFRNTKFKINSVTPGYTATDLNGFAGFKTAAAGAKPIVKVATIDSGGSTGKFFREEGEVPW